MQEIDLRSNDGAKVARLKLPEPDGLPSVLAVAFLKSGSVMLDTILRQLCAAGGRSYVRPDSDLFAQGLSLGDFEDAVSSLFSPRGFVFGVFRNYLSTFQTCDALKKLILIRDPRDAVVSYYFSIRNSHAIPKTGPVKDALLAARASFETSDLNQNITTGAFHFLFENMQRVAALTKLPNTVVYRYEDIVFQKAAWIRSLANQLGIEVPPARQAAILKRVDVFPMAENPDEHIRKVTPGDYEEKLQPETIAYIEDKYRPLLRFLNYD